MKNRSLISIVILMFVVLCLFTTCAGTIEPGDDTDKSSKDGLPTGTPVPGSSLAEKLQWLIYNAENGNTYLLEVSADHELLAPQTLYYAGRNNIAIRLRGKSANRVIELSKYDNDYDCSFFTITNGITLILDNNISLVCSDYCSYLITVKTGGTLILDKGAKISSIDDIRYADVGVEVEVDGGTFTMNGGEISGNRYCGVYVYMNEERNVGGTFTMNGGKISGNNTGVCLGEKINIGQTFTMNGGEISSNEGEGGVSVEAGTFTMNGGTISGNVYNNEYGYGGGGGGVCVFYDDTCTFTKKGGTITGYVSDHVNGNVVKDSYGVVQSNKGHAVCVHSSPAKRRESTAGPDVNMDSRVSGTAGGWEE